MDSPFVVCRGFDLAFAQRLVNAVGPLKISEHELKSELKRQYEGEGLKLRVLAEKIEIICELYQAEKRKYEYTTEDVVILLRQARDHLLKALGKLGYDAGNPHLKFDEAFVFAGFSGDPVHAGGGVSVNEALVQVEELSKWLSTGADMIERSGAPLKSAKYDQRRDVLLERLETCYKLFWKRKGFSRNDISGQLEGPFVRFLEMTFEKISGERLSREGLKGAYRRLRQR